MRDLFKGKKIVIIGCGNMGEALLKGLLASKLVLARNLTGCELRDGRRSYLRKRYRLTMFKNARRAAETGEVLILAVKPQDIDGVLAEIGDGFFGRKLIISIAAGVTTRHIECALPGKVPVIRVMPNTPALVGKGISGLCRGRYARQQEERLAGAIFRAVGEVVFLKENLLNAVTAVSGSGPAYFYYLMESLIKAGLRCGLGKGDVRRLVFLTASGSSALILRSGKDPETLRRMVTSRGGTTEAAIRIFERNGFGRMIEEAVCRARDRARELSRD